ncbi:MAG: PEP-CTERM sorting domain-containing protein [Verrucomicrobiaceae bacterium]|nr:PEP-CTERM sorting domain-containing protein [Verrucomicrobiaceae bacterium]
MFKKILLTSITSLFALSAWSATLTENLIVEADKTITGTKYYNTINFVGSEEDKTPILNCQQVEVNSIIVGAGVDADITNYTQGFYVGCNPANSGDTTYLTDAIISGAGMDSSSLTSRVWVLTAKNWNQGTHQALAFNDITVNFIHDKVYNGSDPKNNVMRGGTVNFTNARLNVLEADNISRIVTSGKDGKRGVNFTNSELNVNTGATLHVGKEGTFVGTSSIYFDNSTATIDGTFHTSGFAIYLSNSTMNVNGALTGVTQESAFDGGILNVNADTTVAGLSFRKQGDTYTGASTVNIADGVSFKGGPVSLLTAGTSASFNGAGSLTIGTVSMNSNNSSLYLNSKNITTSGITIKDSEGASLYIGTDKDGNLYDVNATVGGDIQLNNGAFVAKAKNSTTINLNGRNFNIASVATKSHIGTNVTLSNIKSSRIVNGFIDGKITTTGQQYQSNGWDYSFSLGCWSTGTRPKQIGTIEVGENAEINVLPTTFANGTSTYFGMYGDITIKAQTGKITSNAAAPLTIYGNDNTVIRLQSTDAFAVGGAATQAESTFNIFEGSKVKFEISADNNIGTIFMGSEASRLTLEILSGVLTLGEFAGADDIANIILSDSIVKNSFKITDMSQILGDFENQSNLYFLDADGNRRELGVNLWIEQIGDSGVYNIYTQVPEPAEWALIFGAIAFGFIAYRRRK